MQHSSDPDFRRQLGGAVEIRIGLDLAAAPGYWDVLSFLPPEECLTLLSEAGYRSEGNEHLADAGSTDPLLREWIRACCVGSARVRVPILRLCARHRRY